MTGLLEVDAPHPSLSHRVISVGELRDILRGESEFALLDVREEYDYAQGHLLLSTLLPLSHLELRIAALVPRHSTRIVVTDGSGRKLAERAAARLSELGYADVSILSGGAAAWRAAGYQIFTTTHVLAKTFGGVAEQSYRTPHITAADLKSRIAAGDDVAIFDARTFTEFQAGCLPGAQSCPLVELVGRVPDSVSSPHTLVVVNCASRTRGILGAQSLVNLGLPNPVVVLENGVMAWTLAGGEVVTDSGRVVSAPPPISLEARRRMGASLASRFDVQLIGQDELRRLHADEDRTLFVFDVRTPEAYQKSHWREARSAPGGQLIMTLLQFIGTHRARVVLLDDGDIVGAVTTASWLKQIGRHEVFVLNELPPADEFVLGEEPSIAIARPVIRWIEAHIAAQWLKSGRVAIIDVNTSISYGKAHISGAYFAIRSRLPLGLDTLPSTTLIFTSSDGESAAFAAADVQKSGRTAAALRGGTAGWIAAGFPFESGDGLQLHPFEDVWHSPMREFERRDQAFESYLSWEMALADRVGRDDTVEFSLTGRESVHAEAQ